LFARRAAAVTDADDDFSRRVEKGDHDTVTEGTWATWMAAAQAGDSRAYARLLRDVVPFIRAIAAHRHRNPDRVEDVVQDVLLTIHRVRHTYDPARPFTPWLAAIAQRRSIDALRRRSRIAAREVIDQRAYETFVDPAANREMSANEAADALGPALAALPPGQREALELLKLKEMSLKEASRVSGKSIAALKVNAHRAIKALRAKLRGE
jgi:RNA polymerase sigma-70 factor, ECF subfamily